MTIRTADSEPCVRCIHEGKETRDRIARAVTPQTGVTP